jgi:hypothetical protein
MLLSVKGVFKEGVACPIEKIEGHDGQQVVITFLDNELTDQAKDEEEAAWDALMQLIEDCTVETGITDLAHQHDHYLYGKTKRA